METHLTLCQLVQYSDNLILLENIPYLIAILVQFLVSLYVYQSILLLNEKLKV